MCNFSITFFAGGLAVRFPFVAFKLANSWHGFLGTISCLLIDNDSSFQNIGDCLLLRVSALIVIDNGTNIIYLSINLLRQDRLETYTAYSINYLVILVLGSRTSS